MLQFLSYEEIKFGDACQALWPSANLRGSHLLILLDYTPYISFHFEGVHAFQESNIIIFNKQLATHDIN